MACRVYVGYPDLPPGHPFDRAAFVERVRVEVGPLQWVSPDHCILAFFSCLAAKRAIALFDRAPVAALGAGPGGGPATSHGYRLRVVQSSKDTFPGPLTLTDCLRLITHYAGPSSYSSEVVRVQLAPGRSPGTVVCTATVAFRFPGCDQRVEG
jgi:hypothetical protein